MISTKNREKRGRIKKGRATYCDYLLPYYSHLLQKRERIYLFWIPNRYKRRGSIVNREKCLYISTSVLPLQTSALFRVALERKIGVPSATLCLGCPSTIQICWIFIKLYWIARIFLNWSAILKFELKISLKF